MTKKSGVDFTHRGQADIMMLRNDPDSPLRCDGCHEFLGIMHCARYAIFKRKGSVYYVPCKSCNGMNKRVKGELGRKLDERWQ